MVEPATLNKAIQKAGGDNKNSFTIAIMHSEVATNLENLNLLAYLKQTDRNGIQRDLTLATWNGRAVLIDDSMPVSEGKDGKSVYTTYILGEGAFDYEDIGAKVPYEMDRNPMVKGGQDTLYVRQRSALHLLASVIQRKIRKHCHQLIRSLQTVRTGSLSMTVQKNQNILTTRLIPIARIISKGRA